MTHLCQGMYGNLTGYITSEPSVIGNIIGDLLRMSKITNVVVFQDRGKYYHRPLFNITTIFLGIWISMKKIRRS